MSLTFIPKGLPDRVGELINFDKHRKTAQTCKQIEFYQSMPFALEPLPAVREFLLRMQSPAPAELSARSYTLLPKEGRELGRLRGSLRLAGAAPQVPPPAAAEIASTTTSTAERGGGRKLSMLLPVVPASEFVLLVRAALAARFPHQPHPTPWQGQDGLSFVYGWPETIALDLISTEHTTYVVYARNHCNRADISLLRKLCMFYKEVSNCAQQVRGVIISMMMYEDDYKIASGFGMEVLGTPNANADAQQLAPTPSTSAVATAAFATSVTAASIASAFPTSAPTAPPVSPRSLHTQSERSAGSVMTAMELLKSEKRAKAGTLPLDSSLSPTPSGSHLQQPAPPAQEKATVLPSAPPPTQSSSPTTGSPPINAPAMAAATGMPSVDAEGRVCVTTWYDFLVASDIPPDAAREYERILTENALEIDQLHELTLELLQSLGFRMGHLMRIMKTLECTEVCL